jgi:hypothetical protein
LKSNRYGIFKATIKTPAKTTTLRARLANHSDVSNPFALKAPTQDWSGCPFGTCH